MSALLPGSPYGDYFVPLANSRIALIDFTDAQAKVLIAAIAEVGGNCRQFTETAALTDSIELYSAAVLNLASARLDPSWISDRRFMASPVPLLAIGTFEDIRTLAAINLRANEVLLTPLLKAEFLFRLMRCVAVGQRAGSGCSERAPLVVIADDDPSARALVSGILRNRGFECRETADGQKGLELSRRLLPDLLVLDVRMPFINGFSVLSELRNDPSTRALRVLMLTGANEPEDIQRGADLGASSWLCKPFRPFDFVLRLKQFFPDFISMRPGTGYQQPRLLDSPPAGDATSRE